MSRLASVMGGAALTWQLWRADRTGVAATRPDRESAPFLPGIRRVTDEPPARLVWGVPLVIMALATAGIAWAFWGEVDIVAPATGSTLPAGEVKLIQPAEGGIVTAIAVEEGQRVRAGDLLLTLDATAAKAERDRLAKELAAASLEIARLRAALEGEETFSPPAGAEPALVDSERQLLVAERLKTEGALAELARERARLVAARDSTLAAIARLEAVLPLVRQRVEARRTLVDRRISSMTEFLTLQQELAEQEGDLGVLRAQLREAEAGIAANDARAAQVERDRRHELLLKLTEAERRAGGLVEELRGAERRLASLTLRAPVDGIVHDLQVHTVGGVVQAAEPVMRLVPTGGPLEVEAKILNRDIGFVHVGQEVQVKLETFDFTRYGSLPGRIVSIASDAVLDQTLGPIYPARIALGAQAIEADGRMVDLTPGMAATVDIKTGRRRLIDYILAPLERHRRESLRER